MHTRTLSCMHIHKSQPNTAHATPCTKIAAIRIVLLIYTITNQTLSRHFLRQDRSDQVVLFIHLAPLPLCVTPHPRPWPPTLSSYQQLISNAAAHAPQSSCTTGLRLRSDKTCTLVGILSSKT